MSILDDNILEETDIFENDGGLPGFDEMKFHGNSDMSIYVKNTYAYYRWENKLFFKTILIKKDFIKKYKFFDDESIKAIDVRFSDSIYEKKQRYDQKSYNGICIAIVTDHNREISLFTFTFMYPYVNIFEMGYYAYRLFASIYNNIERLEQFAEIGEINYGDFNKDNLEIFCKIFDI